jgi:hypothetical protein
MPKEQTVSFQSLPGEIRNHVYRLYFESISDGRSNVRADDLYYVFRRLNALCLTCKQVDWEVRTFFFEDFQPHMMVTITKVEDLRRLLRLTPERYRKTIQGHLILRYERFKDIVNGYARCHVLEIVNMIAKEVGFEDVEDIKKSAKGIYEVQHHFLTREPIEIFLLEDFKDRNKMLYQWPTYEHDVAYMRTEAFDVEPKRINLEVKWHQDSAMASAVSWTILADINDSATDWISIEGKLGRMNILEKVASFGTGVGQSELSALESSDDGLEAVDNTEECNTI